MESEYFTNCSPYSSNIKKMRLLKRSQGQSKTSVLDRLPCLQWVVQASSPDESQHADLCHCGSKYLILTLLQANQLWCPPLILVCFFIGFSENEKLAHITHKIEKPDLLDSNYLIFTFFHFWQSWKWSKFKWFTNFKRNIVLKLPKCPSLNERTQMAKSARHTAMNSLYLPWSSPLSMPQIYPIGQL